MKDKATIKKNSDVTFFPKLVILYFIECKRKYFNFIKQCNFITVKDPTTMSFKFQMSRQRRYLGKREKYSDTVYSKSREHSEIPLLIYIKIA